MSRTSKEQKKVRVSCRYSHVRENFSPLFIKRTIWYYGNITIDEIQWKNTRDQTFITAPLQEKFYENLSFAIDDFWSRGISKNLNIPKPTWFHCRVWLQNFLSGVTTVICPHKGAVPTKVLSKIYKGGNNSTANNNNTLNCSSLAFQFQPRK